MSTYSYLLPKDSMQAACGTASTNAFILAINLGKYKSVACVHSSASTNNHSRAEG